MSRPDAALAAEFDREDHQIVSNRQRCPKAQALIERCNEIDLTLPIWAPGADGKLAEVNIEARAEITGLVIPLEAIVRSGRDIDDAEYWGEFEREAVEMIERAEKLTGEAHS
jgi:hypothetical protein